MSVFHLLGVLPRIIVSSFEAHCRKERPITIKNSSFLLKIALHYLRSAIQSTTSCNGNVGWNSLRKSGKSKMLMTRCQNEWSDVSFQVQLLTIRFLLKHCKINCNIQWRSRRTFWENWCYQPRLVRKDMMFVTRNSHCRCTGGLCNGIVMEWSFRKLGTLTESPMLQLFTCCMDACRKILENSGIMQKKISRTLLDAWTVWISFVHRIIIYGTKEVMRSHTIKKRLNFPLFVSGNIGLITLEQCYLKNCCHHRPRSLFF